MLARGLLDTLRAVYETDDNCIAVLDAMSKLSEDPGWRNFLFSIVFLSNYSITHIFFKITREGISSFSASPQFKKNNC